MQVFDASAIVAALIDDGAEGRWCEDELLADDLVAPHLLAIEAANIIPDRLRDRTPVC